MTLVIFYSGAIIFAFDVATICFKTEYLTISVEGKSSKNPCIQFCLTMFMIRSICITLFSTVLLVLRDHLFIWSVFSPKYLYELGWTIFTVVVCILIMLGKLIIEIVEMNWAKQKRE